MTCSWNFQRCKITKEDHFFISVLLPLECMPLKKALGAVGPKKKEIKNNRSGEEGEGRRPRRRKRAVGAWALLFFFLSPDGLLADRPSLS